MTGAADSTTRAYDGFISYSHAADGLLAPRLQAGLQRFAKPWWRRRAVRIFRDESSLSANPHLWSSITHALDSSGWFVLLLSPDAAESTWVNQEIDYWVDHHDRGRILPVVTDGTFRWEHGDIVGDAVPPALRGVFGEEPRWVDVRWARDEDHLDLNDPRFADAVADIASTIRGLPKDDLASEEVKQHRRTVRTAWSAGVVVVVLGVVATVAAVVAVNESNDARVQRDEARRQSGIAQQERDAAQRERDRADEQARVAEDNAALAVREAAMARSGELAAASASTLASDVELAALLATLSITTLPDGASPSVEAMRALRTAHREHRLRLRVPTGTGTSLQKVEVTPDDRAAIYVHAVRQVVGAVDLESGDELWSRPFAEQGGYPVELAISPDGAMVAVLVWNLAAGTHEVVVISPASGNTMATLPPSCPTSGLETWSNHPFSPDGTVFVFHTGTAGCGEDPDAGWATFVETETWSEVGRLQIPGGVEVAGFARRADRVVVSDLSNQRVEVRSYPDLEIVRAFEGSGAALSPDGDRVALIPPDTGRYAIHDVETGGLLGHAESQDEFPWVAVFSPDGETLAITTEGHDVLVDGHDGRLILEFGPIEISEDGSFMSDGSTIVTVARSSSDLKVWDLGAGGAATGTQVGTPDLPVDHVNPDRIIDGPRAAVHAYIDDRPGDRLGAALHVVDEMTGETVVSTEATAAAQLPDGRFVVGTSEAAVRPADGQPDTSGGGLAVWDPEDGSVTPVTDCAVLLSRALDEGGEPVHCADGEPPFSLHAFGRPWILVSPDGSKVAASSTVVATNPEPTRLVRVWDTVGWSELRTIEVPADFDLVALADDWLVVTDALRWAPMVFSLDDGAVLAEFAGLTSPGGPEIQAHAVAKVVADGRFLVGHTDVDVVVLDTTDWTMVARWQAHDGRIRSLSPAPTGPHLATSAADGTVRIWDLSAILDGTSADRGRIPPVLDEIPTAVVSDVRWIAHDLLGVVTSDGTWTTVSLDPAELVRDVVSRLTRSFTDRECRTFRIDPCPTLEELLGG